MTADRDHAGKFAKPPAPTTQHDEIVARAFKKNPPPVQQGRGSPAPLLHGARPKPEPKRRPPVQKTAAGERALAALPLQHETRVTRHADELDVAREHLERARKRRRRR